MAFAVIYSRAKSFRKALLGSLLVGKTFAIVYLLANLGRKALTLYLINKRYPWIAREIHITVYEILFASFLVTAITTAPFPLIVKHAGRV